MRLLRHAVASLIIFAMLIGLFVAVYKDSSITYGFENDTWEENHTFSNGTITQGTIGDQFAEMNLLAGVTLIQASISDINPPTAATQDITGGARFSILGLLKNGFGLVSGGVQTVVGIATFPFEFVNIMADYYGDEMPPIGTYLALICIVYIGFIIISRYMGDDI